MADTERASRWTWGRIAMAVVAALALVAGTIGVAALVDNATQPAQPEPGPDLAKLFPDSVDASRVLNLFDANFEVTNRELFDKKLMIRGPVGISTITSKAGESAVGVFNITATHTGKFNIFAVFQRQENRVLPLKKNDPIVFTGRYVGPLPGEGNLLEFEDCILLYP